MQEAQRRGLSVNDAEVDQAIEQAFGFYAEGTPTPVPSPTAIVSPQVTMTAVGESTPAPTETIEADSTPQPTATAYTRDLFEINFQTYLNNLQMFRLDEQDVRDQWFGRLYRQRVQEAIGSEVSPEQDQVWARHILVNEQELA